jgi:hypothetical protein
MASRSAPSSCAYTRKESRACSLVLRDKLLGEILRTQGSESGHTERCSGNCAAPFGQEGTLMLRSYVMVYNYS